MILRSYVVLVWFALLTNCALPRSCGGDDLRHNALLAVALPFAGWLELFLAADADAGAADCSVCPVAGAVDESEVAAFGCVAEF